MKSHKKRLQTVLKMVTQQQLAEIFGFDQSNISKLLTKQKDVYVHFEGTEIVSIRYSRDVVIWPEERVSNL